MEFTTVEHGETLLKELRRASAVNIAVAYFNPDERVLTALKKVPNLTLTVSRDFTLVNPYKLEAVSKRPRACVRAVTAEPYGKLHSKVYWTRRTRNETNWAMVGSANLTDPGLFSNQEACLTLDSTDSCDATALKEIKKWLDTLAHQEKEIDFKAAKSIWDNRPKYRLSASKVAERLRPPSLSSTGYWGLKPGTGGRYWENFYEESVIAIGWDGFDADPSAMSRDQIEDEYRRVWDESPDGEVDAGVSQIDAFASHMGVDNLVLLCGRHAATHIDNGRTLIYGVARTTTRNGVCFFFDQSSSWMRFKRHAVIQVIEREVSYRRLTTALGIGAFVRTITPLHEAAFARLNQLLQAEFEISIIV